MVTGLLSCFWVGIALIGAMAGFAFVSAINKAL